MFLPATESTRDLASADTQELFRQLIIAIGEDPNREGLRETPARAAKAWAEITEGYESLDNLILKDFSKDSESQQIVTLADIRFYSTCEHHLMPFFGTVHVGYVPNRSVIGVSKIARIVKAISRRLQIQERLTDQIAQTIDQVTRSQGVVVVCEAEHMCMRMRGAQEPDSRMITTSHTGIFNNPEAREEFMRLVCR